MLAVNNGKWCAIKEKDTNEITITKYKDECTAKTITTDDKCFEINNLSDKEIEITGYTCEEKDIVIPK